jgi:tripartite-type tricarboxylate transporter receptor subunit TctC
LRWGQPAVVKNRPGGDGFVAISAFVAAHDDHRLLFAPTSTFVAHPVLHAKLPYDQHDLKPIARITNTLIALSVHSRCRHPCTSIPWPSWWRWRARSPAS